MLQNNRLKGISYILISALGFALMSFCVQFAGPDIPTVQKSFFRNLIAFFVAFFVLKKSGEPFKVQKKNMGIMLLRATMGTLGILFNFYAISKMSLADSNILNKLSPFFVIIFSYFFLKEKVSWVQILAIIIAFIGTIFVIRPDFQTLVSLAAIFSLLGAITAGAAYTCVRYLGNHGEKGPVIVAFFSLFSSLVTLPFLIFRYHPMTFYQTVILLMAGVFASVGQFGITAAYTHAPAKEISIYDYSIVLYAALLDFVVFGVVPGLSNLVGYLIIIGAALLLFQYNRRVDQAASLKIKKKD